MREIDSEEFIQGRTRAEVSAAWQKKYAPSGKSGAPPALIKITLIPENAQEERELTEAIKRADIHRKQNKGFSLANPRGESVGALLYFAIVLSCTASEQAASELDRRRIEW